MIVTFLIRLQNVITVSGVSLANLTNYQLGKANQRVITLSVDCRT